MSGIAMFCPPGGDIVSGGGGGGALSFPAAPNVYYDGHTWGGINGRPAGTMGLYLYSDGRYEVFFNLYAQDAPENGGNWLFQWQVIVSSGTWLSPIEVGAGAGYYVTVSSQSGSWKDTSDPFGSPLNLNVLKKWETQMDYEAAATLRVAFATSATGTPELQVGVLTLGWVVGTP